MTTAETTFPLSFTHHPSSAARAEAEREIVEKMEQLVVS